MKIWWSNEVGVVFNIVIEVVESKNAKINLVTLTDDLEIKGQTSFNFMVMVSILKFLRSGISEKLK